MSLEIREVKTISELKQFIRFYTNLYKNNKQVAFPIHLDESHTLKKSKNPALAFCKSKYWLAYQNNQVVGRIAAIINRKEQEKLDQKIGRFGWFDFTDDLQVSAALMKTAIEWLKQHDTEVLHGPMGFTDMDRQGLLIEGFDCEGTLATLYNYPYYQRHIENLAFEKSTDWVEYEIQTNDAIAGKMESLAQRCKERNKLVSIKPKGSREVKKIAPAIFKLINECYKDLYGFIPLSKEQMDYYTKSYLSFINMNLISLVGDETGKLIGVGIAMPSFTKALQKAKGKLFPFGALHLLKAVNKNDRVDLYLIAVDEQYQNKGVNAIIMSDIISGAARMGIYNAESNIELEDNKKVQAMWRFTPNRQHKRRRCYTKQL
ncbi:hypothetical protein [Marinifilum flexuosum]|uniref:N-acetyltransferase domain-containing protein n=1 Tax=Marinifilum flexuosum TaxID=1117708 RepID=A0A419X6X4_9BACT|nr:hypothetical protein [Marinifilum flexuosum]RKE03359.1 hypothetical protein BXY64_0356 [Marinifilum flexuosum]